jgi:hypothetical protein
MAVSQTLMATLLMGLAIATVAMLLLLALAVGRMSRSPAQISVSTTLLKVVEESERNSTAL